MRILNHRLFQLGLLFAPLFHLRWLGQETFIQQLDPTTQLKMRVNTYDKLAAHEVWGWEEYGDKNFAIQPGDVVVDLGAHIGSFSVWAARQAPNGQVYAFEPNHENYRLLEENKKLNDIANLSIFNFAVSDKSGEVVLFASDHCSMSHSLFETDAKNSKTVRAVSLAEILQANQIDKVDYLKLDVEGAEYLVILNTPPQTLRQIDKIFIEYHDYLEHGHTYKDIETYLTENGFEVEVGRDLFSRHVLKLGYLKARRIKTT